MSECLLSTAYWPPIQYFTKFILYKRVQIEQWETYPKQSFRNRMQLYGPNGIQSLQVPVVKGSFKKIVLKDVEISYADNWQKNHLKTIDAAYRSAPFFEYYIDDILPVYHKQYKYLIDLNQELLKIALDVLDIDTDYSLSTDFILHPDIADYRNSMHPKLNKQGSDATFRAKEYMQGFEQRHGFVANLSILDLIFNTGPEAMSIINESIVK